jgi:hypothetical protein
MAISKLAAECAEDVSLPPSFVRALRLVPATVAQSCA